MASKKLGPTVATKAVRGTRITTGSSSATRLGKASKNVVPRKK